MVDRGLRAGAGEPVSTAYRIEPILPVNDVNSELRISNSIPILFYPLSILLCLFSNVSRYLIHYVNIVCILFTFTSYCFKNTAHTRCYNNEHIFWWRYCVYRGSEVV